MSLAAAIDHLKAGEWQQAHPIVQADESALGCWGHGTVHLCEGDLGNARYWYRRAARPFPKSIDPAAEIEQLAAAHALAESTAGPVA
jgi:hypothetical protein